MLDGGPIVDLALARGLEDDEARGRAAYADARRRLEPEAETATLAVGGGLALFVGRASPLSTALALGMHGPVAAADLEVLEGFYARHDLPATLLVCPLADPTLIAGLARRGYRLRGFLNTHVRTLRGDEGTPPLPADVTVSAVDRAHAEAVSTWVETVAAGFAGPGGRTALGRAIALPTAHGAAVTCFLAYADGEPAGGGAVAFGDGIGALMSTSVLPAFRRRGIQTALIRARLAAAAAAGCGLARASATPGSGSERNLRRAGFGLAYTRATFARA